MVSNMKRNILIISLLILVSVSSVALLILNNAHIDKSNDEEIGAENYCLRYLEKYVKFYTTKKVYYIGEEIVITIINTGGKQIKLSKGEKLLWSWDMLHLENMLLESIIQEKFHFFNKEKERSRTWICKRKSIFSS